MFERHGNRPPSVHVRDFLAAARACQLAGTPGEIRNPPVQAGTTFFAARCFAGIVLYSVVIMMFYRSIVFPWLEPGTVNGILPGDPAMFHAIAVHVADAMARGGWSAWALRPDNSGNAGVLAILYYCFGPLPLASVFLNSALHGIACTALVLFSAQYLPRRYAVMTALPFILSPYQMGWYSQPTKDSFAATGFLLLVYGWSVLIHAWPLARSWARYALGLLLVGCGIALISIVRPYLVQMILALTVPVVLVLWAIFLTRAWPLPAIRKLISIRASALVILLIAALPMGHVTGINAVTWHADRATQAPDASIPSVAPGWQRTPWLPGRLDFTLYAIAFVQRNTFQVLQTDKNITSREALIDMDRSFHNATDVLMYTPRAVEIGFLTPFPNRWAILGVPSRSVFRNLVTIQTMLVYISLAALILSLRSFRHNPELYVAVWYSFCIIVLYALATPHMGALDRYRYPFLMLLVTIGLIAIARFILNRRSALGLMPSHGVDYRH